MRGGGYGVMPVVAVVIAVAAIVVGGGSVETNDSEGSAFPLTREPVVTWASESGGFRPFGVPIRSPGRFVMVSFTTSPACAEGLDYGDRWAPADDACAVAGLAGGEVSGLGTDMEGDAIVSVTVGVSRACFGRVAEGDPWPVEGC